MKKLIEYFQAYSNLRLWHINMNKIGVVGKDQK